MNSNIKLKAFYQNFLKFNFIRLLSEDSLLTALSSVKAGHRLRDIFVRIWIVVGGRVGKGALKVLGVMSGVFQRIHHSQGPKGLVAYLKTCYVITQQALGGHKLPDVSLVGPRVKRNRSGLPRCIPRLWRYRMRTYPIIAKMIMSLFALYRVIPYIGVPKFKTITDPYKGDLNLNLKREIDSFVKIFKIEFNPVFFEEFGKEDFIFPIQTKGPTTLNPTKSLAYNRGKEDWSSSSFSVENTFRIFLTEPVLWDAFIKVSYHTNIELYYWALERMEIIRNPSLVPGYIDYGLMKPRQGYLGKLSLKIEAAGKVRVFAMLDPLTQWAMYPIHRYLYHILSRIPMDGTFNQTRPIGRLLNRGLPLYSFDLSAATDRLPLSLQIGLINRILPIGGAVAQLLVGRPYKRPHFPPELKVSTNLLKIDHYFYAVGQPMGAYGSFGLLAIVHHALVQTSALRAGVVKFGEMFRDYSVLGDDLVIANKAVAREYLKLMKSIGVEIGLHKSLVSPKGLALEFAKRTFYKNQDISPVSLKEIWASVLNIDSMYQLMLKHKLTITQMLKVLGMGYRVLGGINKPLVKQNILVRLLILTSLFPSSKVEVLKFFGASSLTRYSLGTNLRPFEMWVRDQLKCELERSFNLYNAIVTHSIELEEAYEAILVNKKGEAREIGYLPSRFDVAVNNYLVSQRVIKGNKLTRLGREVMSKFRAWSMFIKDQGNFALMSDIERLQCLWLKLLEIKKYNSDLLGPNFIPDGTRRNPVFGMNPKSVAYFDSLEKSKRTLLSVDLSSRDELRKSFGPYPV